MIERELYLLHARLPRVQNRLSRTLDILRRWRQQCQKPYLSWSTGKDSTLMLWLALQVDPQIEVIYFDADSAFPESKTFMTTLKDQWHLNLRILPTRPLLDTLAEFGLDHPRINYYTMRDTVRIPVARLRAEGYDGAAVGIRRDESRERGWAARTCGDLWQSRTTGALMCWPLLNWTGRDVWAVTIANGVPYNPIYDLDDGRPLEKRRLSYWAGETYRTYGRYVWLRRYHPELWRQLVARVPEASRYT